MFGLFKKPDTRQTTEECLQVWGILSERDKASSAKNIMVYAAGLSEQSQTTSAALSDLGALKQDIIRQFGLRDHVDPAYMQVQILSDYIYSKSLEGDAHARAKAALDQMISSLGDSEKKEIYKNLNKFL
jgi:hypothetical protein